MHKKTTRQARLRAALAVFLLGCVLAYGVVQALGSAANSDFDAINGSFQNYNPVRRLLSGQTPFTDFYDYLGAGHLYAGAALTVLFGGTFTASLSAFSFLTFLTCFAMFFALGLSVLRRLAHGKYVVLLAFLVFLAAARWLPASLRRNDSVATLFDVCFAPGNSARFLRSLIAPLYLLCVFVSFRLLHKRGGRHTALWEAVIAGFFGGFAIPWSNDFGFAVFLCALLLAVYFSFCETKKLRHVLLTLLVFFGAALAGALLAASLVTAGHPGAYLSHMLAVGDYQSWYFGMDGGSKHYLWQVETAPVVLLQFGLICVYLFCAAKARDRAHARVRFGVPLFLNLCSFCTANEYSILSNGSATEVSTVLVAFTLGFELLVLAQRVWKRVHLPKKQLLARGAKLAAVCFAVLCCAALNVSNLRTVRAQYANAAQQGRSFDRLGGRLVDMAQAVHDGARLAEGNRIFSLYASAVEVETGQFQPSGYDYVIHVLGDSAREDYLAAFEAAEYDYVSTISGSYSPYSGWIENANWFFLRHVYRSYLPVLETEYAVFWREEPALAAAFTEQAEIHVDILPDDSLPSACTIRLTADRAVNGTADVSLHYALKPDGSLRSKLILRSYVFVENLSNRPGARARAFQNYNIPAEGEYCIAVQLIDGKGEISLRGLPANETVLTVSDVEVNALYTLAYNYVSLNDAEVIDESTVVCTARTSRKSAFALGRIVSLRRGEEHYAVQSVQTLPNGNARIIVRVPQQQAADFCESLHSANCFTLTRRPAPAPTSQQRGFLHLPR